ncbi:hypothetical protein ACLOJK_002210 [Asimina triloba]
MLQPDILSTVTVIYYSTDLFPDIAKVKHERWSEVAPLPLEVVTAVGERTKKDFEKEGNNDMEKNRIERDLGNLMGKLNIESMLSVERELRELTALKPLAVAN